MLTNIRLNLYLLLEEVTSAVKQLLRKPNALEEIIEHESVAIRAMNRREKDLLAPAFGTHPGDHMVISSTRTTRNAIALDMGVAAANMIADIADHSTLIVVPNNSHKTFVRDKLSARQTKPIIHPIARPITVDELMRYNGENEEVTFPYGDNYPYTNRERYDTIFVLYSMQLLRDIDSKDFFNQIAKASTRRVIVHLL
jgi:hypothetical protein